MWNLPVDFRITSVDIDFTFFKSVSQFILQQDIF